jgi:hypothetical protein
MELKKIMVGDDEYIFINTSRSTRNGFAHDTVLMKNGREIGTYTCQYLNRTWEAYQYCSVMHCCVSQILNERFKTFLGVIRAETPNHRLTHRMKEVAQLDFDCREDVQDLHAVKQAL